MKKFIILTFFLFPIYFSKTSFANIHIDWLKSAEELSLSDIADYLKSGPELSNDLKLITWYFGPNGLREGAVDLFKTDLFIPLRDLNTEFYLYDLTSWNLLSGKDTSPRNEIATQLQTRMYNKYKVIFSDEFFSWLKNLEASQVEYIFANIARRERVWEKSLIHENQESSPIMKINPTLRSLELFSSEIPSTYQDAYDKTSNLAYSFLQYLEGIFLVQKFIGDLGNQNLKLLFLLPNDEMEYYTNSNNLSLSASILFSDFMNDLNRLIGSVDETRSIKIYFQSFKYKERKTRPYLQGKVLKAKSTSIESLFDL